MVTEAELSCVDALQVVDQKLCALCQSPSTTLDNLFQVKSLDLNNTVTN